MDRQEWQIKLLGWSGWAPGLEARESWRDWLDGGTIQPENCPKPIPEAQSVPPRLRRRCSTVGRMALETSLAVCENAGVAGSDVHLIYCSRNGELITLKALFENLYVKEPLSPTRFSNSVHHTPMGYFSLITENRRISRTISGGDNSFACGLLESFSLLSKYPDRPVLLIYSDEFVPEPFDMLLEKPEFPFAISMLLANSGEGQTYKVRYETELENRESDPANTDVVFPFLAWLDQEASTYFLPASFGGMTWMR